MKTLLRLAINIVLLTVLLAKCGIPNALGVENDEIEDLFRSAADSDGALTEMYAEKLGAAFCSNPIMFLEKLSQELPSTQDLVISLIYFDQGPTDSFDDKVDKLISENQLSDQAKELAKKLKVMGEPAQTTLPDETVSMIVETTSEPPSDALQICDTPLPTNNDSGNRYHVSMIICLSIAIFALLALLIVIGCYLFTPQKASQVVLLSFAIAIILLFIFIVIVMIL